MGVFSKEKEVAPANDKIAVNNHSDSEKEVAANTPEKEVAAHTPEKEVANTPEKEVVTAEGLEHAPEKPSAGHVFHYTPEQERSLVRKLDFRLVPHVAFLCMKHKSRLLKSLLTCHQISFPTSIARILGKLTVNSSIALHLLTRAGMPRRPEWRKPFTSHRPTTNGS